MVKKVIAVHDISCFGRCSMQVIVPVLTHFGILACPLPTALLSTHTGGFDNFTFLDTTDEMVKISAHWKSLDLKFDAVYSGFLANEQQIDIISSVIHDFATPKTLVLVDPVMGDNGEIYKTYTTQMCDKMKDLCHAANIITPNITEACILTGRDYNLAFDQNELLSILSDLLKLCGTSKKAVVITGIKKGNEIGAYYYDGFTENGKIGSVYAPYCDKFFPGCGDILASMLLGKVLLGEKLASALATAVNFISETSFYTDSLGTPGREGLVFEERLQMQ